MRIENVECDTCNKKGGRYSNAKEWITLEVEEESDLDIFINHTEEKPHIYINVGKRALPADFCSKECFKKWLDKFYNQFEIKAAPYLND